MNDCCWVIKITYLKTGEVNFNEAYWTFEKCMIAMQRKMENVKDLQFINQYTIKDLDKEIVYEAKLVDICE